MNGRDIPSSWTSGGNADDGSQVKPMSNAEFDALVQSYSSGNNNISSTATSYNPATMDTLLSGHPVSHDMTYGLSGDDALAKSSSNGVFGQQPFVLQPYQQQQQQQQRQQQQQQQNHHHHHQQQHYQLQAGGRDPWAAVKAAASAATAQFNLPSSASNPAAAAAASAAAAAAAAASQANGLIDSSHLGTSASGAGGFEWDKLGLGQEAKGPQGRPSESASRKGTPAQTQWQRQDLDSFSALGAAVGHASVLPSSHQIMGRASWDGATSAAMDSHGRINNVFSTFNDDAAAQALLPGGQSTSTPGTESSDTGGNVSSGSTKRRRMTFSGPDSSHQSGRGRPAGHQHLQQQQQQQQQGRRFHNESLEDQDRSPFSRAAWERGGSSYLVNPKELETMAQQSLQRANAENNRSVDLAGHLTAMPPGFSDQHQQSGGLGAVHQPRHHSSTGPGTSSAHPTSGLSHDQHIAASGAAPAPGAHSVAGSAASHPPGLGGSVLKGQDPGSSGAAAANDFTRRKGWANRVVDELLDFNQVLDLNGKILYATNSAFGLTGWKPDQLKGRSISEFAHPQDAPVLKRELSRSIQDKGDILLYYRFKRNPAMLAGRAKTRLMQENEHGSKARKGRERSVSASGSSPAESSSVPASTSGDSGAANKPHPATVGEVDPDAEWVTLEMSAHAYFPPLAVHSGNDSDASRERENQKGTTYEGSRRDPVKKEAEQSNKEMLEDQASQLKEVQAAGGAGSPKSSPKQETYKLPLARSENAQCFFCACRVYPSKSVTVLDSFLELKLENERLRRQLEELNISAEVPDDQQAGRSSQVHTPAVHLTGGFGASSSNLFGGLSPDHFDFESRLDAGNCVGTIKVGSGPTRPGLSTIQPGAATGLSRSLTNSTATSTVPEMSTQEVLNGSSSMGSELRVPQVNVKKKNSSHPSSGRIESLATGSSAGQQSTAASVQSAASGSHTQSGATAVVDEDRVCTDCGRTDSPEWRKGPLGPKTLCNACGLRYAKKMKRRSQPPVGATSNAPNGGNSGIAGSQPSPSGSQRQMFGSQHQNAGRSLYDSGGHAGSPLPARPPHSFYGREQQLQQQQPQHGPQVRSQDQTYGHSVVPSQGLRPPFTNMSSFAASPTHEETNFGARPGMPPHMGSVSFLESSMASSPQRSHFTTHADQTGLPTMQQQQSRQQTSFGPSPHFNQGYQQSPETNVYPTMAPQGQHQHQQLQQQQQQHFFAGGQDMSNFMSNYQK